MWAKFDDGYDENPKCRAAGKDGRALDSAGIRYAAKHLTDGLIPDHDLPLLAALAEVNGKRTVRRLVEVGRWHGPGESCGHETCRPCPPGFHVVHDYLDYNPTAEAERRKRQARSEAGRKGGLRSRPPGSNPEANASANAQADAPPTAEAPGNPVPVPPVVLRGDVPSRRPLGRPDDELWITPPDEEHRVARACEVLARRDLAARDDAPGTGPVRDRARWLDEATQRRWENASHRLAELADQHPAADGQQLADLLEPPITPWATVTPLERLA